MPPRKAVRKRRAVVKTLVPRAGDEVLPGYRLIEPLGRGGFGEVWKCEAPGGLLKAIKFVQGSLDALHVQGASAEDELAALQLVKTIRHPFLLSIERVERLRDGLVIVLELADRNLHALWQEYRHAGKPGIPRDELLGYLREAAEALDVLNLRHGLLHLDVKPQNLFLLGGHVKVGDFGLVRATEPSPRPARPRVVARSPVVAGSGDPATTRDRATTGALGEGQVSGKRQAGEDDGARASREVVTPLYAAAELFRGTVSRTSDQYSLAIVYQELLTGTLPFRGKNVRRLMIEHLQSEPDLGALHAFDRPVIARALAKDPDSRFPSCTAFVQALKPSQGSAPEVTRPPLDEAAPSHGELPRRSAESLRDASLESSFRSNLPRDVAQKRLGGFTGQWKGTLLHHDDRSFVFSIPTPRSFWQRCLGRRPGLEIHVQLDEAGAQGPGALDVLVRVQARALSRSQGNEALQVIGRLLIENLRNHLQLSFRRRSQDRLKWPYAFQAQPVFAEGDLGPAIDCRGNDLSWSGIGFIAPCEPPASRLQLHLPETAETPALEVTAQVVRSRRRDDGSWEIGAMLLAPATPERA